MDDYSAPNGIRNSSLHLQLLFQPLFSVLLIAQRPRRLSKMIWSDLVKTKVKISGKTKRPEKNCLCREGMSEVELAASYSVLSQKTSQLLFLILLFMSVVYDCCMPAVLISLSSWCFERHGMNKEWRAGFLCSSNVNSVVVNTRIKWQMMTIQNRHKKICCYKILEMVIFLALLVCLFCFSFHRLYN